MAGNMFNDLTGMLDNENYVLKQYVTSRLNFIRYGKPEGRSGYASPFFETWGSANLNLLRRYYEESATKNKHDIAGVVSG